jgi:hypothetical protein
MNVEFSYQDSNLNYSDHNLSNVRPAASDGPIFQGGDESSSQGNTTNYPVYHPMDTDPEIQNDIQWTKSGSNTWSNPRSDNRDNGGEGSSSGDSREKWDLRREFNMHQKEYEEEDKL